MNIFVSCCVIPDTIVPYGGNIHNGGFVDLFGFDTSIRQNRRNYGACRVRSPKKQKANFLHGRSQRSVLNALWSK